MENGLAAAIEGASIEGAAVDGQPPTYEEAFPPLGSPTLFGTDPVFPPSAASYGKSQSAWPVKSIPSSTITQVFHVPVEERRFGLDEASFGGESRQSDIIREVIERTGCNVEVSQVKDHSLTIMVSGKPSSVLHARKEILSKLQTQAHIELRIPKEHHKFIIGREGAKLKAIELHTATKVSVPRFDSSIDVIKIMGTREGVDKAGHQIQVISDEQAKLAFERLDIPKMHHPFIMGSNNALVKSICESTGARVNIPPLSLNKAEITVAGEKECVAKAVAQILKHSDELKRVLATISVEVRKSQHKYVVGQRGAVLQDILLNTGVWVEVPPSDSDSNTITLRGPQEKLGQALTQVYEKASSVAIEEVHAPQWLHRFIIGRKGQNVQKITQDLPKVHVEFRSDSDKIVLEGLPEQVQQAKEAFDTFTGDLMATMDFAEIEVDQKYHRHIIGKGGASVSRIKTETGTSIIIPPDTEKSDFIRIEGDPVGVKAAKTMLLEMAAKMENERTKDVIIEHKYHKLIIGSKGEKVREVRDRFNGVQISFPEPGDKKDIVSLRGPKDDVNKCAIYLKKLANDLAAANYQESVRIFKKFHGSVIGKGGAMLRRIREETDTRIELPHENSDSDIIVIIGRKENVQKAHARLLAIEKDMESVTDVILNIPSRIHNSLIGPKGKLVRSVMDECGGVHIQFPPSGSKKDEIKLHGPKEDVKRAETMLLELAEEQALQHHTLEIHCKPEYHRFLIGRQGANIRRVRDQFGAHIIFPQKSCDDDTETVLIIGMKEKAEAAKAHLEKLIKDLENIVEVEIKVDHKYHRHFIQRRGQLIHEIAEDNGGIIISFPRSGTNSDKVTLKGASQCIEGAKIRIQEVIDDLAAQVTVECIIDQVYHRNIMGAKGSNVQAITQEHNVGIKFPERSPPQGAHPGEQTIMNGSGEGEETIKEISPDPRNIIVITGRMENVEAAKQALLDLIPVTVEVIVAFEFHRYIIGQKGREIRSLMDDYNVNIAIPPPDLESDRVSLTGPARNCEEATRALERKVLQLEAEKEERELRSFKVTLNVEPKYHPNIIGKRGATINKIRDSHDVKIQMPDKDGSNNSDITIIGYEHQVTAAKDDILDIVRALDEQVTDEMIIDYRVHSRLIGARGRAISKVMETFKVDIRFPRDKTSGTVIITGLYENVEDAKEHLTILAEDYMQDVIERDEEEALKKHYTRPKNSCGNLSNQQNSDQGFMVRGGPWSASTEDFPTLGGGNAAPMKKQWGPSMLGPKLPSTK